MNILLITRYFYPEIGTAASLFYDLAKSLSGRGHNVGVITGFPWYNLETISPRYSRGFFMKEKLDGFDILRIKYPLMGPRLAKLFIGHIIAPLTSFISGLIQSKPHIVFIYSPPLFMGIAGWLLHIFRGVPFVFGVQDLHPQCYIDQDRLKNPLVIKILESIEKFCYRKSALITVHSEGNREYIVKKKGIEESKVKVLVNWIDTDEIKPFPRENSFSSDHELNDRFVVGYAGTLGLSQGLLSVIEAADILKEHRDIEFFIVGDGVEKENLIEKAKSAKLSNIKFLRMQPKSDYPLILASSDVSLVTLNRKVKTPVVPSKIFSIMAAGRPVLASVPLDGDVPKIIDDAKCGICVEPENPREMAEKILYLSKNRDICRQFGENGRDYVVKNFSIDRAVENVEKIFQEAIDRN